MTIPQLSSEKREVSAVITTPDDNGMDDELLALASAVGVVTTPNLEPTTLRNRVTYVINAARDFFSNLQRDLLDFVNNFTVSRETYVGKHRLHKPFTVQVRKPRPSTVLRRLVDAGTRLDLRVLATLESIGQPPQDVQRALSQIRATADRARREISFYHATMHNPAVTHLRVEV